MAVSSYQLVAQDWQRRGTVIALGSIQAHLPQWLVLWTADIEITDDLLIGGGGGAILGAPTTVAGLEWGTFPFPPTSGQLFVGGQWILGPSGAHFWSLQLPEQVWTAGDVTAPVTIRGWAGGTTAYPLNSGWRAQVAAKLDEPVEITAPGQEVRIVPEIDVRSLLTSVQ